jgi:hypothetical protein
MIVIDHMLNAALKAGWIQVGPGVPVFFRIDPLGENIMTWADGSNPVDYCCRFALAGDWEGNYYIWNKWVAEGFLTSENLQSDINRIFGSYTCVRCPIDSLASATAAVLSDYFWSNQVHGRKDRNNDLENYYNQLCTKLKEDATLRIQK